MIRFFRFDPDTIAPMRADKSALSTLPLQAFQHCEAIRQASGLGWYIFPPRAAVLRFDGREILMVGEDGTRPLRSESLGPEIRRLWDERCPPRYRGQEIPWIEALGTPGILQLWSGLFVATDPGWQLWVKPLTNVPGSGAMTSYEGIVRTDLFSPAPLFTNFRFEKTDRDVPIDPRRPLFQIVPLPVLAEGEGTEAELSDVFAEDGSFDWSGIGRTTRHDDEPTVRGRYGAEMRRRAKQGRDAPGDAG